MDSSSPGWIYLVLTWVCVYGVTITKGSTIATTSVTSTSNIVTSASEYTTITVTSTTNNQTLTSMNPTANYTTNDTTTVLNQSVTNSTITTSDTDTVTMDTTASTMPYNTTPETTIEVTTPVNSTINTNDNMTAVINATTTYMHDNVTTFINATTTQIITSSSNDTSIDKVFEQKVFSSEMAIIAGAASGVSLVIFVVIIAIIKFKNRSNRTLGKRYEVKSRAFTESMAFSDNRESKMASNDLQRISDGNQNYHMIDEETFLSNRKDNDSSKDLTGREQKCDAEKDENGSRNSDSGIDVNLDEKHSKPKTSAKIEGVDKPYIKPDGDVEHVYTKSVKRAEITENDNSYTVNTESKDKSKLNSENLELNKTNERDKTNGGEIIEDDEEVYINAYSASSSDSTKAVNNVDIENKHKLEQNSGNLEIKESNEIEKTNGEEYLEDDDEVYVNAFSASSSDSIKAVNSETCTESLRSAVAKTDNDDVYDFAVPVDNDEKVEEKTKNEKSDISHVNNINIEADDHYEVSKETPNKLETVSEDAIYYNEQEDDDDVIYHNDEMDNNKTSQENAEDDTYDCAMSTIPHEKTSDDIYDSTKESDYDVTQHASEKKRFFIRPSTDDNYDHCELPTEREDYDLVELPENC
ncbi:protein PFC0760c-like isoform X2 [Mytilus californianus]|uniref:protein PFC0760c-like isoform X2 n=1 Tax=Mytilus californianus TaxID=6549 RepID=UPI0022478F07|nr:protein PFC0760c-like isoform X2 [Mytilus californianus]